MHQLVLNFGPTILTFFLPFFNLQCGYTIYIYCPHMRKIRPTTTDQDTSGTAGHMNSGTHNKIEQGRRKLSDIYKIMINTNYKYLGKEPPFKVGRWARS